MRKNLLLTCLLTLVAAFGVAQETTKFPITLSKADGLPGEEVMNGVYNFKSPVYTLGEAITSLRYTVAQTLCSTKMPNNAEAYQGRMTWSPGFPYFSLSELMVFDANGDTLEYVATSNAVNPTDGNGLAGLNDGIFDGGHFHTNWDGGAIDSDYHYVELEFAEPVSAFSIEWRTRYGWIYNQPAYVGLTPGGESYWPMPEQELKVEKISTLAEIAEPNSLFIIEGHVEPWYDADRERTNVGGGFFEAPCLPVGQPSAFGLFTLLPVEGKENTYMVEYINDGHYIWEKQAAGEGFIDWTMDIRKAMEIKFASNEDVAGDFTLTSLDDSLLITQDACMRMACLKNNEESKAAFLEKRPFASNFTMYKASIKASTILYKLEDVVDLVEARLPEYGTSLDEYNIDQKEKLETALATAKAVIAKGDAVTSAEILSARNQLNKAFNDFYALTLNMWVDSVVKITEAIEEGLILVSSAPDWVNNSYPESYKGTLESAIDDADIVFATYETLSDIDAAVARIKAIIDGFWASKVTNVKNLPFRVGREEDGLPGENIEQEYIWESPAYYLTEEVDQLRFTVFKTLGGRELNGKPFVCINEFELYNQDGQKIELTEDCFETTSVAGEGLGLAGLCDGEHGTGKNVHFHSQWEADDDYDGSEYFYLDITLPETISGFKYIQYARGNSYPDAPTDFVFGYYGEQLIPEDVLFPDDNNAMQGAQVESVDEITDNGIYAIYGLLGCSPELGGDPEDGGFYTSGLRWQGAVQSPCAFSIRSTGDGDGTYYIQSMADGKYWASAVNDDGDYWCGGTTTIFKSQAAKVKIESNENDENLPFSFRIYEYIEDSYRNLDVEDGDSIISVKTQCPYIMAQDWGDHFGWYPVDKLENNDKDGQGEWFIYKMSMDTPFSYWLANMTKTLTNLNLVESNDPGMYKDLGAFPAACAQAQITAEAKDEAASKAMIKTLEDAIVDIENVTTNPVVAGVYVIEANNPNFVVYQKTKKAIYAMKPHICGYSGSYAPDFCEEYEIGWMNTPENIMEADSMFQFELIPATSDEMVAVWLDDSLITEEEAKSVFYIRSVKYNKYVAHTDPELAFANKKAETGYISWYGIHLSLSETPQPYLILNNKNNASNVFDFWLPGGEEYDEFENGNLCFHVQDHGGGTGKNGHIVYWRRSDASSLWNLRYISGPTSIGEAPVVEGDEVVSTTYYTVDGVASQAPVKGVNIVKYVYSNGAVKTVKIMK